MPPNPTPDTYTGTPGQTLLAGRTSNPVVASVANAGTVAMLARDWSGAGFQLLTTIPDGLLLVNLPGHSGSAWDEARQSMWVYGSETHGIAQMDNAVYRWDAETGLCRWIDFDFNYRHRENMFGYDIYGLGNILAFLVGKGDVIWQDLREAGHPAADTLRPEETGVIFRNRIFNLRKVYPYLPERLNRILMHFSAGAEVRYETTRQLLTDLGEAREQLREATS